MNYYQSNNLYSSFQVDYEIKDWYMNGTYDAEHYLGTDYITTMTSITNSKYSQVDKDVALFWVGAAFAVEDMYNNFMYNHDTYTTTGNVVKNIYNSDGVIRSARAASFARASTIVEGIGTIGTFFMTASATMRIMSGEGTLLDCTDAAVGVCGLAGAGATYYAEYTVPYLGEGVAMYSWFRFCYDMGGYYGPSTWFK